MTDWTSTINDWSAAWATAMWAVVWQATLLTAAAASVCWALRRHSPALRYWIWLALAAKLLVTPFWTPRVAWPEWLAVAPAPIVEVPVAVPESSNLTAPASVAPIRSGERSATYAATMANLRVPAPQASLTWQTGLLALWLAVVAVELVRTAWQFVHLNNLLAGARPAEAHITKLVADCSRVLGLRAPPPTYVIDADGSPLVCGAWRPHLVLLASLAASLEVAALRQIVLHELAHLRRRDLATVWVVHAVRMAYWFHPAAHWIAYSAGLERELACDQLAMTHSGATAAVYARTLIRAAGRASQPVMLSAATAARLDGGAPLKISSHNEASLLSLFGAENQP